jgi:uncharacterized DUF497 family protein
VYTYAGDLVIFEWDKEKRKQVVAERGVDILYAARIFEESVLTRLIMAKKGLSPWE